MVGVKFGVDGGAKSRTLRSQGSCPVGVCRFIDVGLLMYTAFVQVKVFLFCFLICVTKFKVFKSEAKQYDNGNI